jgi:hypothetical protein
MIVWTVNNFIALLFRILSIDPIYFMFLRDLVSSKIIVIPTIIFTIAWEEVLILRITNKTKLLVLFHGILVYTRNSVNIFQIPGGKYINDIFSDDCSDYYRDRKLVTVTVRQFFPQASGSTGTSNSLVLRP